MAKPGRNNHSIDPLDLAIAPSPDESAEEREERLLKEREAKVVSDAIDKEIEAERSAEKKKTKQVKILLLGGSCPTPSLSKRRHILMYETSPQVRVNPVRS
jgi:guanine nucleotide-binding protein subunit alpha